MLLFIKAYTRRRIAARGRIATRRRVAARIATRRGIVCHQRNDRGEKTKRTWKIRVSESATAEKHTKLVVAL